MELGRLDEAEAEYRKAGKGVRTDPKKHPLRYSFYYETMRGYATGL